MANQQATLLLLTVNCLLISAKERELQRRKTVSPRTASHHNANTTHAAHEPPGNAYTVATEGTTNACRPTCL
eukprot:3429349-Amphidinium_carterae.2